SDTCTILFSVALAAADRERPRPRDRAPETAGRLCPYRELNTRHLVRQSHLRLFDQRDERMTMATCNITTSARTQLPEFGLRKPFLGVRLFEVRRGRARFTSDHGNNCNNLNYLSAYRWRRFEEVLHDVEVLFVQGRKLDEDYNRGE
ncbi:hypothetical protein SFRURICE_006340, partial [Spodoptera frugiperda]